MASIFSVMSKFTTLENEHIILCMHLNRKMLREKVAIVVRKSYIIHTQTHTHTCTASSEACIPFGIFVPQNLSDLYQKCQFHGISSVLNIFYEVSQSMASFILLFWLVVLLLSFCVSFIARIHFIRLSYELYTYSE